VEDEQIRRTRKSYEKRLKGSGLKPDKTLDNYIFSQQPEINRDLIYNLASCEFILRKEKIVAQGKPGLGKSHILNGIGICALEKGYTVYRYNVNDLVESLLEAKEKRTYNQFVKKILKAHFVILDEFAIRAFPPGGIDELFALLDKLDEAVSLAVITNRQFEEWAPFFADNTMASAFTDRMINNAYLIKVKDGVSQRQINFANKNLNLEPASINN
jgi:DNA replication protein DnaC